MGDEETVKEGALYFSQFCQILSIKALLPQCCSTMWMSSIGMTSWHHTVLKGTALLCNGEHFLSPTIPAY
jgi:hypothetical protein